MAAKKKAPAKKPAKKPAPAAKKTAAPAASGASSSKVAKPLRELKPGWLSRVFGIETGSLVACDARWAGTNWERGEKFTFLYRSRRNKYFVLHDVQNWSIVTVEDAKKLYKELPEKLQDLKTAFESEAELEVLAKSRDDDEDDRIYKVVRNDKWEFSIWLDYKEMPSGWWHIGVTGPKMQVLDYIRRNCVFGAPNPGML
jgi:uncharacterized protein YbdZ (MbtH family)